MITPFAHTVHEYFLARFRKNQAEREARLNKIQTKSEFDAYQSELKKKAEFAFRLPKERCPLDPVVTKVFTRPGFHVENVIYHSHPGISITANVYVPDNAKNAPACLFLCGHSTNGKACDTYQIAIMDLVREGYVVLCPDPSGQGERSLLEGAPFAKETGNLYATVLEHNMLSKQMLLVNEYYTSWCLFDCVVSLDYLLTRPEIDKSRVCATGNSGGGNMSAFLTAVDDRLAAVAPSCYISRWVHHVENEEACDAEQEPQFFVGLGCEMGDLLMARAPRPTLILGQKNDFFDARGARDTYNEIKELYSRIGYGDKIELFIGPCDHGYHRENREAMVKFFNKQFGLPEPVPEPENTEIIPDEELQCTPKGQVFYLPGEKRFIDYAYEKAIELRKNRPSLSREELAAKLAELCNVKDANKVPYYRMLRPMRVNPLYNATQLCSRYGLESEENMVTVLKYISSKPSAFHFPEDLEEVTLYIPHKDAGDEILNLREYGSGDGWFGLDIRGLGETMSIAEYLNIGHAKIYGTHRTVDPLYSFADQIGRDYFAEYCDDYNFSAMGLMLGDLYVAGRVRDVLAAFSILRAKGTRKINLAASGQGCVPAVLAAIIAKHDGKTTLYSPPPSFESMLEKQIIPYPQSMMPTGILEFTDLPEIYSMLNAEIKQFIIHN